MSSHNEHKETQKIFPFLCSPCSLRLFLLFIFVLLATSACQKKKHAHQLIVGMDLSYPPFEMINEQGMPAGISVEIVKNLSRYLNRPLEIQNIPFVGLIPSLQTGKIDLIISSMTDTPERRQSIAFSDPYITLGQAVLASEKSNLRSTQQLDQTGRTLAVRQGSIGQLWAQKNIKKAHVIFFDQEFSAVLEVIQGKVDGFIYDQISVLKNNQLHPLETVALLTPLETDVSAIGLRISDYKLRQQVNAFLKTFRSEKGFDQLGDQYLKQQKEAFAKQGIPFYF